MPDGLNVLPQDYRGGAESEFLIRRSQRTGTLKVEAAEGSLVYAGVTPLGEAPLTATLPAGSYRIAVMKPWETTAREEKDVEVLDGATVTVKLVVPETKPGTGKLSGELVGAPEWVLMGAPNFSTGERVPLCGVGVASALFNPVLLWLAAYNRALTEAARSCGVTVAGLMTSESANPQAVPDGGRAVESGMVEVFKQVTKGGGHSDVRTKAGGVVEGDVQAVAEPL